MGWQIDPFGHSNTHAWLSSAVGFDSLFFGRIDYQDRAKRMAEKNMEMIWKGSASDADQSVFTGRLLCCHESSGLILHLTECVCHSYP